MIVAKNCYFWSVFPQISCDGYPQNSSKFPKPHFLLTCTYFGGRRHGRNLPMAKATCRWLGLRRNTALPDLRATAHAADPKRVWNRARQGHIEVVRSLTEAGSDKDKSSNTGSTPLRQKTWRSRAWRSRKRSSSATHAKQPNTT